MSLAIALRRRRRGFMLIEALIALCVVMIGLGGAARLQLRAQRAAFDASRLSDGVRLTSALAERMRANPAALAQADARNPYLQFDYDAAGGPPDAAADCYGQAACTSDTLAAADLHETALAVAAGFPRGRILLCRDGAGAVPASWACDDSADAPLVIKLGWSIDGRPATPVILLPVGTP